MIQKKTYTNGKKYYVLGLDNRMISFIIYKFSVNPIFAICVFGSRQVDSETNLGKKAKNI